MPFFQTLCTNLELKQQNWKQIDSTFKVAYMTLNVIRTFIVCFPLGNYPASGV